MLENQGQKVTVVTSTKSMGISILLTFIFISILMLTSSSASESRSTYFTIGPTAGYLNVASGIFEESTLAYGIGASYNRGPFRVNVDYIQADGIDYSYEGHYGGFGSFSGEAKVKRYGISVDYIFLDNRDEYKGLFLGVGGGVFLEQIKGDANFDYNSMYSGNYYFSNINSFVDMSLDEDFYYVAGELIAGYKFNFVEISLKINASTDSHYAALFNIGAAF